jgi:hypothetical protein
MRRQQARRHGHRVLVPETPRDSQHACLALEREAVARLDLDRGHALRQQRFEARAARVVEHGFAGRARRAHGREDSAALGRDASVALAGGAAGELGRALAGEHEVRVAVDHAGWCLGNSGAVRSVGRYNIPLGDVKIVGPVIIAILAGILIRRTAGKYTIWLAVVILVSSIGLLFALNPEFLQQLFRSGLVEEGIRRVR